MRFMKEKGKRYMAILMVCAMMVGLFPVGVYAESPGTKEGPEGNQSGVIIGAVLLVSSNAVDDSADRADNATYQTLGGAISKAESGDTIKLQTDVTLASGQTITDKNLILDLNGHRLTGASDLGVAAIELKDTASLEVKDTSPGATGQLSGSSRAIWNKGAGSVTVSSGTVTSAGVTISNDNSGSVTVSGGTVSSDGSSYAIWNNGTGSVTVAGGTVTSNSIAISNDNSGSVTVSEGTVSGSIYAINSTHVDGKVNISSGTISSTGGLFSILSSGTSNIVGGELGYVNTSILNLSGDPTLTVNVNSLTSKRVSITGALTGAPGSIKLNAAYPLNTDAGTVVATATEANYADASKFVLINVTGKTLAKSGKDIVFAADSPAGPSTDWNGIIPTSDPGFVYSGGSGTEASPYLIANSYDLAMLASNVNTTTDYSVDKHFKMTADIDLNPSIAVIDATTTAKEWTPIGKNLKEFKGTFDGGGFAVKGMYLKDIVGENYRGGLFGKITNSIIKNLGVTNSFVNIINPTYGVAGIICFADYSTVESCYNTAKINGYASVGGVVGTSSGSTVKNCYNTGEISGTDTYVGGVTGQGSNTIFQDCYNTGNISGLGAVGGIVGAIHNSSAFSASAMYRCYNIGNIVASESVYSYGSNTYSGSCGIAGWVRSWTSTIPKMIVPLDNCVSLGLSVSTTTIDVHNTTTRVAQGNGAISNSYARSDLKVNDQLIFNGTKTNEHGQNLTVAQNTAQDWSTWFGSAGSLAWDYPEDGKLWYQAPLPTLKGVGGIQNPKLPGTGSGSTDTYTVTGTVKDKDSNPVTGATVTLTPNAGTPNPATTGNDGKYTMNNVPNGSYTITVILPSGGGTFTKNITVPDDISSGNIDLQQPAVQTYTVTYNGNKATSGSVSAQTTNVGTATTVAVNSFARTGFTFAGWNTAANGGGTAYTAGSSIPSQAAGSTVTLYAQWAENTYGVSGTVKDHSGSNAAGASVKLMQGDTQIGSTVTTGADGTFLITGVPNGTYNLVVEKDGIIVTTVITVSNGDYASGTIRLPAGKTNSVVVVTGSETPRIVVGNLDGQFSSIATDNDKGVTTDDNGVVTNGGSVEIKLTAERRDDTASNAGNISAAATANGRTVGIFLDLAVQKTVKDSGGDEIASQSAILTELPSLIDVYIPLPAALQGKSSYVVYRYHGAAVNTITTEENNGEKLALIDNDTTIKLTVKKFSTYAIAYTTSSPNPGGNTGGGSSSSSTSSAITAEQSGGGKIIIGTDKKTVTITPDIGYVIADVLVDGKNIGATEKYTFTDSKAHKISAVFVKDTELPYYKKNDGRIYIGFSAIAGNMYKYIAPTGETVAFRENPKNFTDNTIAWAKPSIDFVTERELFLGTSQDVFSPNESMTRAMFVTVIGRLYERSYGSISEDGSGLGTDSVVGASTFSDVNTDDYYAKYVAWANDQGIIKGMGENRFAPREKVTREQMAVIMLNFADFLNKANVSGVSLGYTDSPRISSWATDGAKYCQETKVITGRDGGSFAPQENATRAEVAAVIERFIKTIVK
ncbi:hypothetical protein FRZ06_21465 [Anoxybacterium hadale]|uniref:Uncharacterized protein n=1 Tax=Anoxybacterium hadale TaxID=3408580 RepID=A0ACD1AGU9_9FIRM|nr:hypothetical protein FRZ06_21465 [Clostridiales bacterium]